MTCLPEYRSPCGNARTIDFISEASKGKGCDSGYRDRRRQRIQCTGVMNQEGSSCARLCKNREGFEQFMKMTVSVMRRLD